MFNTTPNCEKQYFCSHFVHFWTCSCKTVEHILVKLHTIFFARMKIAHQRDWLQRRRLDRLNASCHAAQIWAMILISNLRYTQLPIRQAFPSPADIQDPVILEIQENLISLSRALFWCPTAGCQWWAECATGHLIRGVRSIQPQCHSNHHRLWRSNQRQFKAQMVSLSLERRPSCI